MVIYGPSGSGKSFFTADIAQHIATGAPWRGRKVTRGLVVYVASEAGASILKRFVAWRDNRISETLESIPLAILTRGPNLIAGTDFEILAAQLTAMQQETSLPLMMVVFDTLSRSMPGGDENNAEDMTRAVRSADHLRDQFNCATVFVHHSGKDSTQGARGHSSLFAAADLVLRVVDKQAAVEKIRDGVAGEQFGFALTMVEIGRDADGDPVTTCLLDQSDATPRKRSAEPLGKNQRIVLKEIRVLSADAQPVSGTSEIPPNARPVRFEDLAGRAVNRFPGMARAKARGRISDALTSLQASGHIGVHGELIWTL